MTPSSVGDDLPTGTVTFLFTDIEGSTALLRDLGDDYAAVQDDHMRLMREAIAAGGGVEIRTEGDAFFAVFPSAPGAVRAAVAAQRALHAHRWPHGQPLRVRMGLHTGEGRLGGDDYLGIDVNRAARIAAAGHGGQVLLSEATRALVAGDLPGGVAVRDLGRHRLKDFDEPQPIHDLAIDGLPSDFPPPKTLEVPTNLPPELTAFVGRDRELRDLRALLGEHRLVTLTGPGGTGKTRLAVRVARDLLDGFTDGVVFVDLSPIVDPALVPSSVAQAAGIREEPTAPILDTLKGHLRDRQLLLVLDNFEQVVDAADVVSELLAAAGSLKVLATSRSPLRLRGEREYAVSPLALPDPTERLSAEALSSFDSVALFVQRAEAVDGRFTLTDDNASAVADICRRLDGLPLAIELAASRIKLLPPESLRERLERRLPLLAGGARDAPARQRTLRSTIEWSHDLLDDPHRTLFRRLAVFVGGWTLEIAEAVTGLGGDSSQAPDLLEGLGSLVDNSLVVRDEDGDPRFRMLETIRELGVERLEQAGEADDVRERHGDRFLHLAEEAEPNLTGDDQARWVARLSVEHDNLRAALGWAIERDRGPSALRLVGSLWRFWQQRGHLDEGRRWVDLALVLPSAQERTSARARAQAALGGIAYWQGDFDTAIAAYEERLEIHRALGDRAAMVQALFDLGTTRGVRGDVDGGQALLEESLELAREVRDRRGEAWALWGLAATRTFQRDLDAALDLSQASVPIFEEAGDRWGLENALTAMGALTAMKGDLAAARSWLLRAISLAEELKNEMAIASELETLAGVMGASGQHDRALRLGGAASTLKENAQGEVPLAFRPFPDPREAAGQTMAPDAVRREWEEGTTMTLEQAVAYAREEP